MIERIKFQTQKKIQTILLSMQDEQTLNYAPSEIVLFLMFSQRISVIFPLSNFADQPYDDYKLKFISDLLNWSTLLKPLAIEDQQILYTLIFYFLSLIQWLVVAIFILVQTKQSIISGIYRVFFSIFQPLLIQPTLIYLSIHIQNQEYLLVTLMLIPIIINIITYYLIQRNYCLPIQNPFHKRYSIFNFFNITFDIVFILTIQNINSEQVKDLMCLCWFTVIQIDAIFVQPYSFYVNNQYIMFASVQFFIVVVKLISFFINQSQFFYILFILVPLLTLIQMKIIRKYDDQLVYYGNLNLKKILLISDLILSKQTSNIEIHLVLNSIRKQHTLQINPNKPFYQQIHYLLNQLFDLYISNLDVISRYSNEDLFLYKIIFLIKTYTKAQLGYIFLKSYQANSQQKSYYFSMISVILEEQIKTITEKKTIMSNLLLEKESKLNLFSIRQAEILYENGIKLIQKIVDSKIKFWVKLQQGYKRIEEFAGSAREISILMWSLKKLIYKQLKINPDNLQRQINHMNVIELKILSILYSVILNDLHSTLDVENRVDELLSMERNISSDEILNTTLIKDELILLSTSIVKNRGQFINQNRAALAQFFGYEDDKEFITIENINSFMPNFIQKHHDEFLNDYIRTGYSSLFDQSREVFYIMKNKHIKCCYLTLVHIYENLDDYIITGALQKVKDHMDFIIFDEYGKIVGITEQAFISLTETDLEKQSIDRFINNAYIYFWFQQIFDVISKEREEIALHYEVTRGEEKNSTVYPLTSLKNAIIQNGFLNKQHFDQSFGSMKVSEMISKFTETTREQKSVQIPIFMEEYRQKITSFCQNLYEDSNYNQSIMYQFRYNIKLRFLGKQQHPIFIMQIYEINKHLNKAGQSQSTSQFFNQRTPNVSDTKFEESIEFITDNESNFQIKCNISIINKMIILQNNQDANSSVLEENTIQFEHKTKINANFGQIAAVPKHSEHFREPEENQEQKYESNLISPRDNQQKLIYDLHNQDLEDDDDEMQLQNVAIEKSSSRKTVKQDIAKILQQNKEGVGEVQNNFAKSQASSTSENTQTYIYTLLRSLSYTQKYQTTIIKAVINTILLFLILFSLVMAQLIISRNMTSVLVEEIPLVRIPDRFNRLFCTFVTLGQMDLQFRLLNQTYSPYFQYRMLNESAIRRNEMQQLISGLRNEFTFFENSRKLVQIKIRLINQFYYEETVGSMTYFWQLVNEVTQQINQDISSDNITDIFKEQISVQMLKGNLNSQLTLTQSLVEQIREQFFSNKDTNQFYQLILMSIQLIIIFSLIVVQFNFWQDPYIYQQNILLLIARVSEQDIENINIKLKYFKENLNQATNQWKLINYYQEFYQRSKKQNIQKTITSSQNQSKKNQNKAKLTSRIQETQFSLWQIYLMLFILWAQLSAFCISSYLYQNTNIQNSQPELELCMTFVKFKSDFDGVMILSQLLKNQQILIDETMKSGVFARNPQLNTTDKYFKVLYDEMLTQFVTLYSNSVLGFSQIYSNIVSSQKLSANNKILLLGLYQEDLCKFIGEELPFCNYENGIFKYFPTYPEPFSKNNNRESFKYGLNGLYSQIESIFKSYYNHELKGEKDTFIKEVQSFIDSAEYNQLILGYYFDINKAMVQFYITIIQASIDILEEDYQKQFIYSLVYGIFASVLLFLIIAWRSMSLQREIRAVRQALVLIPHENLLDQQTYNAIKRFERTM